MTNPHLIRPRKIDGFDCFWNLYLAIAQPNSKNSFGMIEGKKQMKNLDFWRAIKIEVKASISTKG
jgi:hypothetical protein